MEIILNLVWTCVSLGLLLVCGAHLLRGGPDRRRAVSAIAVVCLICLLFPVISATDDINAASPALVEPSKVKKVVVSTPAVLILVSLFDLLKLREESKANLDMPPNSGLPQQNVFAYHLSRRPPPEDVLVA